MTKSEELHKLVKEMTGNIRKISYLISPVHQEACEKVRKFSDTLRNLIIAFEKQGIEIQDWNDDENEIPEITDDDTS